jgi:hypothetical protein
MFWKLATSLSFILLLQMVTSQTTIQRLCDQNEPQLFPSFCKFVFIFNFNRHNNPYIIPYYLTNLNNTLNPNDSKVHCDSNNINSDCYCLIFFFFKFFQAILKIRVVEIHLEVIERYFVFSMGNGKIAVLPFNNEVSFKNK